MNKVTKLNLKPGKLIEFSNLLFELSKTKGHGLSYEIGKNLNELKKKVEEFQSLSKGIETTFLTDETKAVFDSEKGTFLRFYNEGEELRENETIGNKLSPSEALEYNQAKNRLENDSFIVGLVQLDEKKVKQAFEKGIFEGVDVSPLFELLEKLEGENETQSE